jgi:Tol biopolymer transport system component
VNRRLIISMGIMILLTACTLPSQAPAPTPDLLATLSASTPLGGVPAIPTSDLIFSNPATTLTVPTSSSTNPPPGKIVFTCQVYKVQASNQICIINADGTGFRRLTTDSSRQHYYPSLSPDGQSVVYAAFREENIYELYEMDLASGEVNQLTSRLGVVNAPEISPDGTSIAFTRWTVNSNRHTIMLAERNGANAANIPGITGWDPTWSPDGEALLFASDMEGSIQLYTIHWDGKQLRRVSSLPALRGRSDWSNDGRHIVTYSGAPWKREVYLLNADGTNARVLSPAGGNSQGPSFSPDGQWVAFTAYYDHPGDDHGCEIYILRIDGTDLRRLTDNDYCDYQPRWGS